MVAPNEKSPHPVPGRELALAVPPRLSDFCRTPLRQDNGCQPDGATLCSYRWSLQVFTRVARGRVPRLGHRLAPPAGSLGPDSRVLLPVNAYLRLRESTMPSGASSNERSVCRHDGGRAGGFGSLLPPSRPPRGARSTIGSPPRWGSHPGPVGGPRWAAPASRGASRCGSLSCVERAVRGRASDRRRGSW